MSRIRPHCFGRDDSDRSARADVLLREEPAEEEDEEDEGNVTDGEPDDDEEDEGYSLRMYYWCDEV